MLRGLVALLRIAREIKRIRQILEIAFSREIEVHEAYKSYKPSTLKSDIILDTDYHIKRDIYGNVIDEEAEIPNRK